MGIYNALYTGSSGLSAFGESVRIIGDNIANINSLGFKSQNVVFSDVLSQTVGVTRSNIANQVGNGVRIGQITRDQQQGSIQNTTNPTDMAINGNGMFALSDPASGQTYYSRAGAFILDKDSNLIDGQGFVVQGWATNEQGDATGNVTGITFGGLSAAAQPTTKVDVGVTLDSNALAPTEPSFDPNDANSYNYKAEANIYDSLGQLHAVSVYYVKEANNQWSWHAGVSSADVAGSPTGLNQQTIIGSSAGTNYYPSTAHAAIPNPLPIGTEISAGTIFSQDVTIPGVNGGALLTAGSAVLVPSTVTATVGQVITAGASVTAGNVIGNPTQNLLTFGTNGELTNEVGIDLQFPWKSAATSNVAMNFGAATTVDLTTTGDGLDLTVQMAGSFATRQIVRDGFASGFLDKLETDSTGRIFGVFTNGQRRALYQVALAKFPNDAVLNHVGNNLQQETISSGSPILEKPGNGGMGTITPYGLEQSNVDLAGEFVKLIVVQRGYEANSKTISTTDQMLSSLMQLKR